MSTKSEKCPLTSDLARVLQFAVAPINPGARLDSGMLRYALILEARGMLEVGQRSNGTHWIKITRSGRKALAEWRKRSRKAARSANTAEVGATP
jgi:hypothetical protein